MGDDNVTHALTSVDVVTTDASTEPYDWSNVWAPKNAPLLTVLAVDSLITIFCVIVIASCIMCTLNRRHRRREERDKIGRILREFYWDAEEQISRVTKVSI